MTTKTLMSGLFHYKASVDEELVEAMSGLGADNPAPELAAAIRVLNHAHIVDRIFVANLQKQPHARSANWSPETPALAQLSSDIRETDRWYVEYIGQMSAEDAEEIIGFSFTDGGRGRMSREEMLGHVITHGGYHRGEVGRLLPQIESTAMRDVFAGFLHRAEPQRRG